VTHHLERKERADVIVFGHTHLLDRAFRPFGADSPVVVTSGAWQRTVHPLQIKQLDAPPESLPPCYSFMRVPTNQGRRRAEASSWRLNEQQQWVMANGGC
jgi:hypothetical protein